MTHFTPFDAADYLDNEATIAAYLTAALEDPDPDTFLAAVKTVARARGMTQLAKDSGLGRVKGHGYFPPPGPKLFSTSSFSGGALLGLG